MDEMFQRFITIGKGDSKGIYEVKTTLNGYQWWIVFRGSLKDCRIVRNAFLRVGYKAYRKNMDLPVYKK